ncbi:cyclase family protein [Ruminiclostridium cellobioparum]|jgi:kynurenine formamidase|uniref:cyclase family protein n=1 Tax=Ruminiclostridium cellobioparum TaxID=29355 RepID=UPI00048517F1|nr:cyclase family protein [Ruminiclostridium cellobioparum]
MKYVDLSQPIHTGMPVYPGDSAVILKHDRVYSREQYNNHSLETGMHVGTHIDGRMHMLDVDEYIGNMPLEQFSGRGGIIHSENESVISLKPGYQEIIEGKDIILFHTGMDRFYGSEKYYNDHPVLDISICKCLAANNIKLVGVDMPSPDRLPFEIHKFLLQNNIFILENLTNLDLISEADVFEVFAFPLKINADSSMVRAIARIDI